MLDIRSAQEKDIPFILFVNREIDLQNNVDKPSQLNEATLKRDIFSPDPVAFVDIAFQDNEPVGLTLYGPLYFASSGRMIWISQLYTKPEYRKKGVAKTLINFIKSKHANEIAPINAVCWATMEINKDAQAVFENIGAKKTDGIVFYSIA